MRKGDQNVVPRILNGNDQDGSEPVSTPAYSKGNQASARINKTEGFNTVLGGYEALFDLRV